MEEGILRRKGAGVLKTRKPGFGPGAGKRRVGMTSSEISHLWLVSVLVGVSIRCCQLVHEVHPDLFTASRSVQR